MKAGSVGHPSCRRDPEKQRRGLKRRLARSELGHFKSMADFEWKWHKKIARAAIESAQ